MIIRQSLRSLPADSLVAFAVMVWIGLFLPDYDQWLHLHRWAVTHSALPLLAVIWLRSPAMTAGLALGLAAHLSADLFPAAMRGTALIKLVPGMGFGRTMTFLWLTANILVCAAIADRAAALLGGTRLRVILLGSSLALAAAYVVFHSEPVLSIAAMGGGFVLTQGRTIASRLFRRR